MAEYVAPTMPAAAGDWVRAGYHGAGNVAGLLGSATGRPAIVAGNAEGVFAEVAEARRRLDDPLIFAANDVGMYLDRLDHWVSLHVDHLAAWKAVRWLHHRGPEDVRLHAATRGPGIDYVWAGLSPLFALSGYVAMQVAWLMGCAPIVLCGCPGSPVRRFFEAAPRGEFGYGGGPAQSDRNVREQLVQEMRRLPEFKAVVRSLSPGSWTRAFFGGLD